MRKISILAFIIAVLLTGSLYLVNQRVNDLANKVASLIKVGASQSISSLTELTSLSHNDVLPITEVNGLTTKKVKWGTATSTLRVINDALYSPIIGSASITTLGTITTGTWNADTLTVAKGGTGSTSLIAYQLLAGNGTGAITTFGNGTSGYVLTSNGAGSLPSFQNVGVTLNNNNTWTGTNTFTATSTFATTTHNAVALGKYHFGGSGSDGALNVTSGETVISLGGEKYVEKNYTSIAITGTGKVSFSNPSPNGSVIVLRSQGSCTLTSSMAPMLTATGTGSAAAGALSGSYPSLGTQAGITASSTYGIIFGYAGGTGGALSGATTAPTPSLYGYSVLDQRAQKYIYALPGAGGGSGGIFTNTGGSLTSSGAGGRGGGALIMECAGAWNFTTASGISVAGVNGGSASGASGDACASGGGGGGGGMFLGLYNFLIANSGTVVATGGSAGTESESGSGNGPSGATGGNSSVNIASNGAAGSAGCNAGASSAGANGTSTIMQNTQME